MLLTYLITRIAYLYAFIKTLKNNIIIAYVIISITYLIISITYLIISIAYLIVLIKTIKNYY